MTAKTGLTTKTAISDVIPQTINKPLKSAAAGPTKLINDCGLISNIEATQMSKYKKAEIKKRVKLNGIIGSLSRYTERYIARL